MINVIIPAYNCTKTLSKTLASLVAQTDSNFEVIVVDDCSTEDIKSIVDDYANKLSIIYIRNEKNMGCGMSRQVGIDNATQKFITFLDSDDMFMPYTVETFNAVVDANPDLECLHSYFYEQNMVDGNPILALNTEGYTWCHGKLYNVEAIRKHGIRNSPEIRWSDDVYFNSMCTELMDARLIKVPTMLWVYNKESVTLKPDPERDKAMHNDFFRAIQLSSEFVLSKKDQVEHLERTLNGYIKRYSLNEEELEKANQLFNYIRRDS